MEFDRRLICFIDLLGFHTAIKQAEADSTVRAMLYSIFDSLGKGEIEGFVYGAIPIIQDGKIKKASEIYKPDELIEKFQPTVRMQVTQFSDSLVLSVPAENEGACEMLIKAVCAIKLMFFFSLGMLMRGGISLGPLIHIKNGPLFGPAMNHAYHLESKEAIYPRVVVSENAHMHLEKVLNNTTLSKLINKGFDGKFP